MMMMGMNEGKNDVGKGRRKVKKSGKESNGEGKRGGKDRGGEE